ncbi:hypothetical protein METSCH_A01940 [Metschnikowia aff. pulcherrima]|uniref:Uncharacterized protein n=1 Tax=Metschnikowia aff. pulcherrima TaxID=2163413 RepID=A0A4P6XDD0_9ASCO|nr:hypothetical protein METSCH_A01940 [Metschnikowia aff. pulcherrima]
MTDPEKLKRPQVQHGATSPDLAGYLHVDDPTLENTDGGSEQPESAVNLAPGHDGPTPAQLLLQLLTTRQNDDYRHIRFELGRENPGRKYEQRVLFDTINIRAAEDPSLDFLDDESKAEFLATRRRLLAESMDGRGRGLDRDYLSLRSPGTSPNGSPTRVLSPLRGKDVLVLFQRGHLPYPTTPILTRKCCTLTRIHKDFEDLYLGNLASKGLWPTLRGRVIMVYVSGRKHTWVAMDWILCNFVQHGDTVVIVSSIPHALGASGSRFTHYPPPHAYPPKTEKVRQRQRNRPEYIKQIAANVMAYALSVVNRNAIVKLTVEIAEGKTKDVLKDMYKLYEPNLVVAGSKLSVKNSAPLKSWTSSRLSDRLVKLFPLPVIVVPAPNLGPFERRLGMAVANKSSLELSGLSQEGSERDFLSLLASPARINPSSEDSDAESISDRSLRSESSTDSEGSSNSYSSFDEIADLYNEYKSDMNARLDKLKAEKLDESYFANFIKTISDLSLQFCRDLKDVDPDFRGLGAKLAREITGSNSFGAVPYKTKSLLPPVEKAMSMSSGSGISYSELKRNLKMNAQQVSQGPSIKIDPPASPLKAPKALALKFAEGEKPSRRMKTSKLQKFLSHEDLSTRKINLEPSKSQPDLTQVFDLEDKKKKKRKKFWKLF